jgi:hypothetical protein
MRATCRGTSELIKEEREDKAKRKEKEHCAACPSLCILLVCSAP